MLTGHKTDAIGSLFTKASSHNSFGKVYLNNMDENLSFSIDTKKQIRQMFSNSKTAFFIDYNEIVSQKEYSNCMVKIQIMCYLRIL